MISVVIPAYNVKDYIETCLNSVMNQTFTDWEAWLIDDGSSDGTETICDNYEKKDARFHVIHQQNAGLSEARNCGIRHADGEYLLFVDSDDFLHPQMLQIMDEKIHISDADMVVCAFRKIYEGDDESTTYIHETGSCKVFSGKEACYMLYSGNRVVEMTAAWNKLYKKELFQNLKYPKGKIHEDEYIAYRLLYSCQRILYVDEQLYNYRQRNGSIMYSKHYGREHMSLLEANENAIQFYSEQSELELAGYAAERAIGLGRMLYENYGNAKEYELQREVKAFCNHIRKDYRNILHMRAYDRLILLTFCKTTKTARVLEYIRQLFWKTVKGMKHAR